VPAARRLKRCDADTLTSSNAFDFLAALLDLSSGG
jgi:hypothetical protein